MRVYKHLSPEHEREVRDYYTLREFFTDIQCLAWARALSGQSDYIEDVMESPDPADPLDDLRNFPERFRASLDRLPEAERLPTAKRYRRVYALFVFMGNNPEVMDAIARKQ